MRLSELEGEEPQPVFSPDGKQVAFVWSGNSGNNRDIYVSLVGTHSTLRLTTDPASDTQSWSPDGLSIAFHRDGVQPKEIQVGPGSPRQNYKETSIIAASSWPIPLGAMAHLQLGRAYAVLGDQG
ncbi:MAG: transcriptional regulatory protein-like protein [Bryobacterales bacterium]|nr:transcriptional regulatory protein-like protein [Bryobacterales bacterium]